MSCGETAPPLQALAQADAVFAGRVEKVRAVRVPLMRDVFAMGFEVTLAVERKWKGVKSKTLTVVTGSGGGDCGYEFKLHRRYLVYAYAQEGALGASICTRTKLASAAEEEMLELDGRLPVPKQPARPPTLEVLGRIDDKQVFQGLIFTISNRLHDRLGYLHGIGPMYLLQVKGGGKWEDYPPVLMPNEDPRNEAVRKRALEAWREKYNELAGGNSIHYLDRLKSEHLWVRPPEEALPWRVGLQYETERELGAGKALPQSSEWIWSEAISPDQTLPTAHYGARGFERRKDRKRP